MLCNLINILKKFYNYKNNLIYKENNEQSSSIININKLIKIGFKISSTETIIKRYLLKFEK